MARQYKLSDSESDSAPDTAHPSDQSLEKGLRDEVAAIFKNGNMEELTVKRVRLAAEKKLGVTEGYFKQTGDWKARSEEIIKNEVEAQENANSSDAEPVAKTPSPKPKKAAAPKRTKSQTAPKPRKRQKTQTPISEDEEQDLPSDDETSHPKATAKSDDNSDDQKETEKPAEPAGEESESEMSVVLDEEPKPKPARQRKSSEGANKEKKKPAPKAKAKDEDLHPDQAEIKRLQGWLVKCGIRKMWFRELAPYDTAKAKIKHLKGMLEDAGMTGRYSQEKANKIRDERELKADLEQIQQGAKDWGTASGDGGEDGPPPRRAARGRQALAFLDSDGEETD